MALKTCRKHPRNFWQSPKRFLDQKLEIRTQKIFQRWLSQQISCHIFETYTLPQCLCNDDSNLASEVSNYIHFGLSFCCTKHLAHKNLDHQMSDVSTSNHALYKTQIISCFRMNQKNVQGEFYNHYPNLLKLKSYTRLHQHVYSSQNI